MKMLRNYLYESRHRFVPVRESDTLIDQTTLEANIRCEIEENDYSTVVC